MEPEDNAIPPVPVGLEHVLGLAAAHEAYAERLASDRDAALEASGVALTPRERAMLVAAPAAALTQMAQAVRDRLDEPDRRRFFAQAAAALALLGGGAALAGCRKTGQDERDEEQERIRQHRLRGQQARPAPMEPEEVPPATMQPEPAPPAAAVDAGAPPPVAAAPDAAAPPPVRPRPVHPATGTGSRPRRRFEGASMGHLGGLDDI